MQESIIEPAPFVFQNILDSSDIEDNKKIEFFFVSKYYTNMSQIEDALSLFNKGFN